MAATSASNHAMKKFILPLCAAVILSGCDKQEEVIEIPLRSVKHQAITYSSDKLVKTFSGVTKAELEANLSFRVSGRVDKIPVSVGDNLKKGQLVARLDNNDYSVLYEQAKAELASAKASLRSAESEYNRTIGLYEKRNASKSQLDTTRASSESAKAQVKANTQQVEAARLQLSYANLYSPQECIVSSKPVKENENVSSGQVVVSVNCGKKVEVIVDVPESYIDQVKEDQKVNVALTAVDSVGYTGRVTEISSGSSDQASAFPVTITLDGEHEGLRAGLAAEVEFTQSNGDEENYFILPVTAVAHDEQGDFTFILTPGDNDKQAIVKKTYVEVKEIVQQGVRVTSGLSNGDNVVTAGITVIRDGMTVKVE
ncbi:MAG: efflux RND transporter periplasmic adaptor subunit [Gammaproteobacteria bacterium]|nr:efflux RND transporter periplasmic adaptor subunit [Gammaproteobacteria bacterium]